MELMEVRTEKQLFTNKELDRATKKIIKIGENINKQFFEVAVILNEVSESKCYEEDGFQNIKDYASKVFGFEKSKTYNLINVAKNYIDSKTKQTTLPHEEGNDFSPSQVVKMLSAEYETVYNLVEEGTITTKTSCREIERILKELNSEESAEGEGEGETPEVEEFSPTIISLEYGDNNTPIIKINGEVRDLETAIEELKNWVK